MVPSGASLGGGARWEEGGGERERKSEGRAWGKGEGEGGQEGAEGARDARRRVVGWGEGAELKQTRKKRCCQIFLWVVLIF